MKTISLAVAGQERIDDIQIDENTTAADVLRIAKLPVADFELSPAVGLPPFGKDERIYDRVKPNGKIIASPVADAGDASKGP